MTPRYATTADLPATLPVFPLAGAILLPRATLPLNIFEPRYLRMIDDCLRGDRLVGIIQPQGGGGETGSPQGRDAALRGVGCAGRLTSYHEMEDGRLAIALTGIARFRPGSQVAPDRPYRVHAADWRDFAHDLAPDAGAGVDRARLGAAIRTLLERRGLTADWTQIERADPECFVNWLAMATPLGPQERQALMEAAYVADRAAMLAALVEMELAGAGTGGGRVQ